MQPLILIVTAIAFLGALGFLGLLYWRSRSQERERQMQIARRIGTLSESEGADLFKLREQDPVADAMGEVGANLNALLLQAGQPYSLQTLTARCGAAAAVGVVAFAIALRSPAAVLGVAFGAVPVLILSSQAAARARKLSEQLPDALDLVARSLQAGHGLSDALRLCAEEMPRPVAEEFGRIFEEQNLGRDLRDSMNSLSERNPKNFDLKLFVSSVMLQRDTGGNLIEILNNIAATIRDRFVFEAKVSALTAEARFSAIILGVLPFALLGLIAFLRPSYLTPLIEDQLGNYLVIGGLTWFSVGVVIMKRISSVEV
jgi:tight adherence protein B